jgi:uncharacterized protein YndB with AHSA1/START domain
VKPAGSQRAKSKRAAAKPKRPAAKAAAPAARAAARASSTAAGNSTTGERNASDEAVRRATGRDWAEWFSILDAAGASKLEHKLIAQLAGEHGAGPWWQQMVAVEFEQARGLRKKHETPSGFQISRSITLQLPVSKVYEAWADPRKRERWLRQPVYVRTATAPKSMRMTWADGKSSVEAYFWKRAPRKCQVTVQHTRLPDERAGERMKAFWGAALSRFQSSLE